MIIYSTEFLTSSVDLAKCPAPEYPEYVFVGRSNVGKSSLINMVLNKRGLAKTSGTPGKTRTINHYVINKEKRPWFLVDLPGYGYAKVSKKERTNWEQFIGDYLRGRENVVCIFVLVDARHTPQQLDIDFVKKLGVWGLPFAIVFTKIDKVRPREFERILAQHHAELLKHYAELPNIFFTSAEKQEGRDILLRFIEMTRNEAKN